MKLLIDIFGQVHVTILVLFSISFFFVVTKEKKDKKEILICISMSIYCFITSQICFKCVELIELINNTK